MRDKLTKKYSNGEITVIWKPDLCVHSTLCWKGLGSVFNPNERPWVKVDGATTDQIIAQVDKCPSGALSYQRDSAIPPAESAKPATTVEVTENGPLILTGGINLRHANGQEEVRDRTTAFCRCGQSGKKPFCDGSHTRTGFKG